MKPIPDLTDDELAALARRAARLPDAPPDWQRAAESLWQAREAAAPSAMASAIGAVLRRVVAALAFDSAAGPALAPGMRSVGGPVRQLLFSALDRDIDLRVAPHDDGGFVLQGQVLGPDAGGRARLRLEPVRFTATMAVFFAAVNASKWIPYAWLGLIDLGNLTTSAVLAPLAPVGVWAGVKLVRRVSPQLFYRLFALGMLLTGTKLLWDGLH